MEPILKPSSFHGFMSVIVVEISSCLVFVFIVHFQIYKYVSFRLTRKPYPKLCQMSTIYDGVRY